MVYITASFEITGVYDFTPSAPLPSHIEQWALSEKRASAVPKAESAALSKESTSCGVWLVDDVT